MDSKKHFDCLQGGNYDLPSTVNLMKFTAARMEEIQSMKATLSSSTATKLAFQTLPKHMRRRAMSHNPKRVPKGIRSKHLHQMSKSGMPPPQKRPSRKYRRRPRNLQDEYMRRQRKITWLETHIWHAKRFHMINKWGYRLPERPCDKAFRACYRATAKHSLLQDISYFSCVSITGPLDALLLNFKNMCDGSAGLTFAAKAFLNGRREGSTTLFSHDPNSKRAIGTVYFIWNPMENGTQPTRTIWIWIHCAFYADALQALINCFSLDTSVKEDESKFYRNNFSNVTLKELRYDVSRFRLTGPLSTSILQKTLKTMNLTCDNSMEWKNLDPEFSKAFSCTDQKQFETYIKPLVENCKWFKKLLENPKWKKILDDQNTFWKSLEFITSVNVLSPHAILSLVVTDPRYNLPKKRTKAVPECENLSNMDISHEVPQNVNNSVLWDTDIRELIPKCKIPNNVINELRSNLLVPGSDLQYCEVPIPIMLVQRPGCRNDTVGYGNGWDIIIPSGWGQSFWIALIMWGARAGGLREFDSILFESGQQQFLPPDTSAGKEEEKVLTEVYRKKYFSLPPNKRINYHKMNVVSPFSFNWENLLQCWRTDSESLNNFYVLRNKKMLQRLQDSVRNKRDHFIDFNSNCLVPVKLKLIGKGAPKTFATICLPKADDIALNKSPTEPMRDDPNQQKRKNLRDSHKLLLKRLSRKRKRSKQQGKIIPIDKEMMAKYTEEIRKLWLPDPLQNVRYSSLREVIGFVVKGGFSFTQGCYCATGYIVLGSFPHFTDNKFTVLVRNTNSRLYRFAVLNVIVE